jgi:hypothetical protein
MRLPELYPIVKNCSSSKDVAKWPLYLNYNSSWRQLEMDDRRMCKKLSKNKKVVTTFSSILLILDLVQRSCCLFFKVAMKGRR